MSLVSQHRQHVAGFLAKLDKGDQIVNKAAEEVAYLDGYTDAQYGYAHNPQGFSVQSGLSAHTDAYDAAYTRGYAAVNR